MQSPVLKGHFFSWIEPVLRGNLSYKVTLNTGLIVHNFLHSYKILWYSIKSIIIFTRKHDLGTGILGMDYTYKTPPYPILYYTWSGLDLCKYK